MSQAELAKLIGVAQQNLSAWETDLAEPSADSFLRLGNLAANMLSAAQEVLWFWEKGGLNQDALFKLVRAVLFTEEYERILRRVAEARVHGLITQEQCDRLFAQGRRFANLHNAAGRTIEQYAKTKSQKDAKRLPDIHLRLMRELLSLSESVEQEIKKKGKD